MKAYFMLSLLLLMMVPSVHAASPSQIKILSFDSAGTEIFGYWIELWGNNGATFTEGCFTPCAFTVTNGDKNFIAAADFDPNCFNHWADGPRERFTNVTISAKDSSTSVAHNVVYSDCSNIPTLSVSSVNQSNAPITGYYTVLFNDDGSQNATGFTPVTFTLDRDVSYSVQVQNFGGCAFAQWADTQDTVATRFVSISSDTSLVVVYNCS